MFNIRVTKKWKIFSLILVLAGLLIVSGCGSSGSGNTTSEQKSDSSKTEPGKTEAGKTEANKTEPSKTDSGQVIELKFAHFEPATNDIGKKLIPGYAKAIEEATNGRVKITIYPGETLLKSKEIYDGVVSGIADIGFVSMGYNPGKFPVMESTLLPGHPYDDMKPNPGGRTHGEAVWNLYKKFNPPELKDVKLLNVATSASTVVMTTKKPIRTLDDMKGLQLRTLGPTGEAVKKLGGIPVGLPMPEVKESLSKGIIQGNVGGAGPMKTFGLGEYIKYITNLPGMSATVLLVVMNGEKFNSLPPDIQKAIEEVSEKQRKEIWSTFFWKEMSLPAIEEAKQKGTEVIDLPEKDIAKLQEIFKAGQENYAKELDKKGLPGKEIMDTFNNPQSK